MNRYVIRDLKYHGDDFMLLKIRAFFSYFRSIGSREIMQSTQYRSYGFREIRRSRLYLSDFFRDGRRSELYRAAWNNNIDLMNLMILAHMYHYHWNIGLRGACRGGHLDLAKLMIEKGASDCFNLALEDACLGGHREIVDFLIEKGARNWNWGIILACQSKHQDLVKLMIEKGATKCGYCFKTIKEHLE